MPEEIKSDSVEILKLKAQLESVIGSKKKTKSKRKRGPSVDPDSYIDSSIIEALEEEEEENNDEDSNQNDDTEGGEFPTETEMVTNQKRKKM